MNTTTEPTLPDLDDARIGAIERTVFSRIAHERAARRRRRVRGWAIGGAAAAIVVVAAVIAPAVTDGLSTRSTSYQGTADQGTADQPAQLLEGVPVQPVPESASGGSAEDSASGSEAADAATGAEREIVSTASATVVVDDVRAAADAIAAATEGRGGYVESKSVGGAGSAASSGDEIAPATPYSGTADGWIVVRVPADQLTAAIADLDAVGEVTTSALSAQDVTDQAIDLRARISAAEASVARLTELMSQAQSTADLIAAESALQERQAALDADRQQLAVLEGQVDLASLSVQLTTRATAVEADPAGFTDGVAAGWNGVVATVNGIVIALGFLLPWIAVLAVAWAIVRGVIAIVRRARRPRRRAPGAGDTPPQGAAAE